MSYPESHTNRPRTQAATNAAAMIKPETGFTLAAFEKKFRLLVS
ncbi:MAG: hypothetical protein ACK4K3_07360 [Aquabacterium sp.]